jgi:hypothetical protein
MQTARENLKQQIDSSSRFESCPEKNGCEHKKWVRELRKFHGAGEVIVLKLDRSEIFGQTENEAFLPRMEPGDGSWDEAFKCLEAIVKIEHRIPVEEALEHAVGGTV